MKKIIAIFVMTVAFGLTANAQQRTATPAKAKPQMSQEQVKQRQAAHDAAISDVNTLNEFVTLTSDQKVSLKSIFEKKHNVAADNSMSDERKKVIYDGLEYKLKSVLTPEQLGKLQKNPDMLKSLTH